VRGHPYEGLGLRLSGGRHLADPALEVVAASHERAREDARWRWQVVQSIAAYRRLTPDQLVLLERWLRQPPEQAATWRTWA
jgi:hypothetical protein